MKIIPFPPEKLPLQNVRAYRDNPIAFVGQHIQDYGDIFGVKFGKRNVMISTNPAHAQHVLQGNHRNYIKAVGYQKMKKLLGDGLLTSDGEHWLNQRRQIQPAFQKDHLSHFAEVMIDATEQMVYRWKYFFAGKRPCNLLEEMSECTLEIVCESLLGQKLEGGGKIINEELPFVLQFLIQRVLNPIALPMWMPIPNNKRFKKSVKKINGLITTLLFEKKRQEEDQRGQDLLTLLLQAKDLEGNPVGNQQIIDEVLTFFLAGHETSAVALTWAIYEICRHPEVAQKLKQEITEIIGSKTITPADLPNFTYTEQVCKEVLRLYPPAWAVAREAKEADIVDGYDLESGETLVVNNFWLHRNPEYWDKPLDFIPERWEDENVVKHKFAYIPFGGGPRLCIGNHFAMTEMKIILVSLFQNFQMELASQPEGFDCALTLRPKQPIMLNTETVQPDWNLAKK